MYLCWIIPREMEVSREEQSPLSAATDCPATGSRCTSSVVLHPHKTSHNATSTSAHLLTDLAIPKRGALESATRRRTLRWNRMEKKHNRTLWERGPRGNARIICNRWVLYTARVFLRCPTRCAVCFCTRSRWVRFNYYLCDGRLSFTLD